jgi:hypothetical protein
LYLAKSLPTAVSEPALHMLLTFHVPKRMSLFRCLQRDISYTNITTICNVWTSLAVEDHRLGDRLFAETVVFTVEWWHLIFAVCVQSLHLQLVVTETYTGNIMWQEDYWQSPRYRLAQTQYDNADCSTAYLSPQDIPQQSAASTVLHVLNSHAHSAVNIHTAQ